MILGSEDCCFYGAFWQTDSAKARSSLRIDHRESMATFIDWDWKVLILLVVLFLSGASDSSSNSSLVRLFSNLNSICLVSYLSYSCLECFHVGSLVDWMWRMSYSRLSLLQKLSLLTFYLILIYFGDFLYRLLNHPW